MDLQHGVRRGVDGVEVVAPVGCAGGDPCASARLAAARVLGSWVVRGVVWGGVWSGQPGGCP